MTSSSSGGRTGQQQQQQQQQRIWQMKEWKHADLFRTVLDEEFDEAVFISDALQTSPFRQLEQLAAAMKEIDDEIRAQVGAHQDDFLSQAAYVEELEVKYQSVQNRVRNLKRSVGRLKNDLLGHFDTLQSSSLKLANIQSVNEILWHCHTIMKLVRRLRVQTRACAAYAESTSSSLSSSTTNGTANSSSSSSSSGGNGGGKSAALIRELAKAAQTLSDIDAVVNDTSVDMNGIDLLEQQMPFIETSSDLVRKEARRALDRAVDSMNRNDIGGAFQVFYNLGELGTAVDRSVKRAESNFKQSVHRLLDVGTAVSDHHHHHQSLISRAISTAASASTTTDRHGGAAGTRGALWKRMDEFMEHMYAHVQQVWNLQLVLSQKVDPVSHTCFLDVWKEHRRQSLHGSNNNNNNDGGGGDDDSKQQQQQQQMSIVYTFWRGVCGILSVQFQSKTPGSKFVTSVFTNEYPRLHRCFDDLFQRLQRSGGGGDGGGGGSLGLKPLKDARHELMSTLLPYQYGFLSAALTQLNTSITSMFTNSSSGSSGTTGNGGAPSLADVSSFISLVHKNLEQVSSSATELQTEAAKTVAKAVLFFVSKCEGMLESKVMSVCHYSVSEVPSVNIRRNAAIFTALCQVDKALSLSQLRRTIPNLATNAETVLRKSWTALRDVCNECLRHLVSCVALDLDGPLRHVHHEDFNKRSTPMHAKRSKYIQNMQLLIDYFLRNILTLYQSQRTSLERRKHIAEHMLWLAEHVVNEYVLQVSLIHPMSEAGKLELTADIAHMEGLLHSLVPEQSNDATVYQKLRSLKDLLFTETTDIVTSAELTKSLGAVCVCQHVLSRHTTADGSSPMPAETLGWLMDKYLIWLRDHSEEENLKLVQMSFRQHLERLSISSTDMTNRSEYVRSRYPALFALHQYFNHHQGGADDGDGDANNK